MKGQDKFFLVAKLIFHVVLCQDELLDSVVLGEVQSRSKLNGLVELSDFGSEVTDDLAGFFFLLFGCLDQAPSLVDFLLEETDG